MAASKKPGGWLFKEEPEHYGYDQLEKDGETVWDGVTNALALKYLRSVTPGDRVLLYHTGKEKAIVGEMVVTAGPTTDSADRKLVVVKVKPVRRWARPVTLAEIKKDEFYVSWDLVRNPRLSVMPVSPELWLRLESAGAKTGT
jgi:predicted RNA-binding protein with PUA-like domain